MGSADVSFVGKIKPILPFNAYHLSQWSLYLKTKEVENFKKLYYKKFSTIPHDSISYTAYTTAMAGINAYLAMHDNSSVREKILKSIKLIVTNNPDKYRSRPYVFYELNKSGERFVESINPTLTNLIMTEKKRILITGATGNIGMVLCRHLATKKSQFSNYFAL